MNKYVLKNCFLNFTNNYKYTHFFQDKTVKSIYKVINSHFARNISKVKSNINTPPKPLQDFEREMNNEMLEKFYLRSKLYAIEYNKPAYQDIEEYKDYYDSLINNFKSFNVNEIEKFIRAICHFSIKEEKSKEIFSKILNESEKKLESACLIFYALIKLEIEDSGLNNKIIKIIHNSKQKFIESEKSVIVPFVYAVSEKGLHDQDINNLVDKYVEDNISSFNEYVNKHY
jgi:hypothetical protein